MDKIKFQKSLITLLFFIGVFIACLYFYDWKLFVIIFFSMWANNLSLDVNDKLNGN